jgi:AraC-like DNA-binding protein
MRRSGAADPRVRAAAVPEPSAAAVPEPSRESVRGRPAAPLRPFIAWYTGFRQVGRPARHRGLPSPYLTMIFTLDEPLTIARHPDPRQPPGSYDTLVGGLHSKPALITHDGRQSGIQLGLSPLGARELLHLPAGELADIDLEGSELLGSLAAEIYDRLRAAPDWPGRFTALDELLSARLRAGTPLSGEMAWAWQELLASGGRVAIADLASQIGWSSRHLRDRFRAEIGLTPKAAARVIRFDRTRRLLQRQATAGAQRPLADLAADCGCYDQAHLAREFRDLAGCPPSAWLAEECRNVQAASAGPAAGWPS